MNDYQRIQFYVEDVAFEISEEEKIKDWIFKVISEEGYQLKRLTYIFCSDEYLHKMNVEYLQHDTYTDIITFPYSYEPVESDLYISVERVKDNAEKIGVGFKKELYRVIIHGLLHLLNYDDKNGVAKERMRNRETELLAYL